MTSPIGGDEELKAATREIARDLLKLRDAPNEELLALHLQRFAYAVMAANSRQLTKAFEAAERTSGAEKR